jgi:hypothetical protein
MASQGVQNHFVSENATMKSGAMYVRFGSRVQMGHHYLFTIAPSIKAEEFGAKKEGEPSFEYR